jgi:hypothetical protein
MSRDFLPAPVDWPGGGRRKRHKRRRHSRSRTHRDSSRRHSGDPSSRPTAPGVAADVLTQDEDDTRPPEGERRVRQHRRRKRGLSHSWRRWRRRAGKRKYSEFMGRGSSPRAIAQRYERQSRRRKRLVVVGLLLVVGGVMAAGAADAYLQASRVLDNVRDSGEALKQVRSNLIRGKLPPGEAFADAARAIGKAQEGIDQADLSWKAVRALPILGLPVSATEHLLEASRHELKAAIQAKNLLEAILGTTLEEAQQQQEDRAAQRELLNQADLNGDGKLDKDERARFIEKGGVLPGNNKDQPPAPEDPNALLNNGRLNLQALKALVPGVETLHNELQAAEDEVKAIGTVPFVSKVQELRLDLIGEVEQSRLLSERALAGLNFIPAFMGSNERKNYLLLFADSGYLRGTGGAYFAYAELTVKSGKLGLVNQGPIIDLDKYRNEDVPIPQSNWYLQPKTAISKVAVRMNNLNWDPHFPNTAPVAKAIYEKFNPGHAIDGVFQIDITGVSYLVDAIGPIQVDSWPDPIGGNNLEHVALIDSYVDFSAGGSDATDSGKQRKAFNADLVNATWRSLQDPKDLVRTVFQLSQALAERHMQVWVAAPKQQTFFEDLGWAGALNQDPGDYLYVVDQNLGDDTLDVFASERVDYDVVVKENGDLDVTATVKTTNFVDTSLPYPILDNDSKPVKKTYVNLYAPSNAQLHSVTFSDRFKTKTPKVLPPHQEAGRVAFSASMSIQPQETASLVFKYTVPGGLLDEDGDVYRLNIQRQPRYVDQSVKVHVTFPKDWEPKFPAEEWEIGDGTATYFIEALEQDQMLELRF